jgi:hypothetical protein
MCFFAKNYKIVSLTYDPRLHRLSGIENINKQIEAAVSHWKIRWLRRPIKGSKNVKARPVMYIMSSILVTLIVL